MDGHANSPAHSGSGSDEQPGLSDQIFDYQVKSVFDHKPFVPEGCVDEIVRNRKVVLDAMKRKGVESKDDEDLAAFILEKAKKVFAITISVGFDGSKLHRVMQEFRKNNFHDANGLPIQPYDKNHVLISIYRKLWNRTKIHNFERQQWDFMAPVFSTAQSNQDFNPDSILPFIFKESSGEGAFSNVYKVSVHQSHYIDPEQGSHNCPMFFALKQIRPGSAEERVQIVKDWEAEVRALQQMNELKDEHIVKFITAFRREKPGEEDHYLMFEWADGGNLRDFWNEYPHPILCTELVQESIRQFLGLAKALKTAHNLTNTSSSIRHGDLKPENILWFKNNGILGTLKIGDWGLAKHHNVNTEVRDKKTSTRHGTRGYEPPEVHIGIKNQEGKSVASLSRLYDIWAMGCVALEFLIWLLYGVEELRRFGTDIKGDSLYDVPFYQCHNGTATVHEAVVKWMDHISRDPNCAEDTALGDLLRIVRTRLLVIDLPPRRGSNDITMISTQSADETIRVDPPTPNKGSNETSGPSLLHADIAIRVTPSNPIPHLEPNLGPFRALATNVVDALTQIYIGKVSTDNSYWNICPRSPPRGPSKASPTSANVSLMPPSAKSTRSKHAADQTDNSSRAAGLLAPAQLRTVWPFKSLSVALHFSRDHADI